MTDDRFDEETGAGISPAPGSDDEIRPAPPPRVVDKRIVATEGDLQPQAPEAEEIDEVSRLQAESAQYLDDLRRLKAEFENYRKRVLREQTSLIDSASAALVEQLLPVMDDFELALIAADRTKDYDALVRGVELVFSKLREVLDRRGLKKIEAQGEPFDPELHEAVMSEEGTEDGKPVVTEVFRPGYTMHGKVVRPAMVKVRKQ